MRAGLSALKVSLPYLAAGILWIAVSDHVVEALWTSPTALTTVQTWKGSAFVFATAAFIHLLAVRELARLDAARRTAETVGAAASAMERRYRALFQRSPSAVFLCDRDSGEVLEANHAAAELYGWSEAEWRGRRFPPTGPGERGTTVHLDRDGDPLDVEVAASDVEELGRAARLVVVTDIRPRMIAEREMRLAATVVAGSREGIMIVDADLHIQAVNPAFTEITGYPADEVRGRKPTMLRSGVQDQEWYGAMWAELATSDHWEGEIWNRRRDGNLYPEWLSISAVRGSDGVVSQYIGIFSDLSERKRSEATIHKLAHYDSLTGLPNRVLLAERLRTAVSAARVREGHVAVLFVDIDRFKDVNDAWGHSAGDAVLREVGQRLRAAVRDDDVVGRMGGDAYVVILPRLRGPADAAVVARKIQRACARPLEIGTTTVRLATSVGISLYPTDGSSSEELMSRADGALHQAIGLGRSGYAFASAVVPSAVGERLALASDLREAVENEAFVLHYQPQVDLGEERLVGVEALLRWTHPCRGPVSPGVFVPLAEETGLIVPIGEWVLRTACRQARAWQEAGHRPVVVAVNVSALQFNEPDFVDLVAEVLASTGLAPEWLELEVTESVVMADADRVVETMDALRTLGVRLSIDDFGTGYSSLAYLRRLAVHKLKIDRSFVKAVDVDQDAGAVAAAVIGLARSLRLVVIAEGVETAPQAEFLRRHGCHEAQGWLYAPALPAEEIPLHLAEPMRRLEAAPTARPNVVVMG